MAIVCLAKVSPLNPATGSRVDLYVSSAQDRSVTGLNGVVWEPALVGAPTLSINLWQGDFKEPIDTGGASFSINMGILKMTYGSADTYNWAGAPVEIYAEEPGAAWPWAERFKGRIASFNRRGAVLSINASIDTEPFDKDILTETYAGTGDDEGGSDLKGRLKPLIIGWAQNVEPVLIDAVNNVYQFSGYGPIEAVSVLYERAADFGASVADHATYAALVAATIPAGRWATCLAAGMVRLGAPAAGVITGDVRGHKVGSTTPRLTGSVISALATLAGVSTGDIEGGTLTALDTAVPYPINLVLTDQAKFRDMASALALACNWQSGITLQGKFFVLSVSLSGSEVITLNAQGNALPQVVTSDEGDVSVPYYQTIMGANRCWRVQTSDEIAFAADLIDRGDYSSTTSYREGNIVSMPNGSRWLYIATVAGSGVEPGTNPAVWSLMSEAFAGALSSRLTNESHVVAADFEGTVASFAEAGGTFILEDGQGNPVTGVTFSVVSSTGVTITIDSGTGAYAVTAMSADTGSAVLRAAYGSLNFDRVYSIAKANAGGGTKSIVITADREYITHDGNDVISPSSQTTTFTATKQNSTATVTWGIMDIAGTVKDAATYLSGLGTDSVTITAANWNLARGSTRGIIITAIILDGSTYTDSKTLVKIKDGVGGTGGVLTPSSITFPADVDGNVTSFAHGAGIFRVYIGGTEVTNSCTFSRLSQTNCTTSINAVNGVYSVSAFSAGSDTATAVFRAVYGSTVIDVTLALNKAKAGVSAKAMRVSATRQSIAYDSAGSPSPSTQTTTFTAAKQNTTATVSWTVTDAAGVNRTPVTSFLSASTGDSVTMTEAQFASARNGTSGVIVRGTLSDGGTITDTATVLRVQDGAAGAAGTNGTNGTNGLNTAVVYAYRRSATTLTSANVPSATVTYTFAGNNTVGLNNSWTATIPAGTDPLYVITAIASSTGSSDTISSGEWSTPQIFAQNGADGAAGANGAPGVNAKTLRLTGTRQVINYDDDGLPTPATQTTTFAALKQNTTATVNWSITDAAGVNRTPVTSFLSNSTGDSVTMTETQFASARNGTTGVIVTASLTDGTVISDTINVTRVQQGLPGVDAQILSLTATGIAFSFNASGSASPSSQTITFTANLQNVTGTATWSAVAYSSSGTNLGSVTLGGTGNTRTMTNTQFMAPGVTAYVVVTASLGSLNDTCTIIKVSDGANGTNGSTGATGPSGLAAFLTNDAFNVPAYADGTVSSYSGATGSFRIFAGNTDVSSSFTLSTQSNPQTLTVSYLGQTYTVTGGLDTSEETGSLTIRATGSGSYSGVTIDRVFSLGKNKGGYEIVASLPTTNLFSGRVVFNEADDKLYRYTGAAWTSATDASDLTGQIAYQQIGNGAVRVQHLLVAPNNLNPDPQFRDPTLWWQDSEGGTDGDGLLSETSVGWFVEEIATAQSLGVPAYIGTRWIQLWSGRPGQNNNRRHILYAEVSKGNIWRANAGQVFECKAGIWNTSTHNIGVSFNFFRADGGFISNDGFYIAPSTGGAFSKQITAPANASYGRVVIFNEGSGAYSGRAYVSNISVRDTAGASMIVDGAVQARHLTAGSVTTDKLDAGAVTAAKVASTNLITLSAQINDGIITSAKIGDAQINNAKIGNLQVDTIKIANNAVTSTVAAQAGSGTLNSPGTVNGASVAFASTGGLVRVDISTDAFKSAGATLTGRCQIIRDIGGVQSLVGRNIEIYSFAGEYAPICYWFLDTPGAVTATYIIRFTRDSGAGVLFYAGQSIAVTEFKR